MKKIICVFMILFCIVVAIAQTPNYDGIIYVTPTGAGTHTGDSWANATSSIAEAQIFAHEYNAVVWVAEGVYYGDTSATAVNAFTFVEGVNVYGGFSGNEPTNYNLSLRDFDAHETVLDGAFARRVLYQPNDFQTMTIWDGFTIRNGNASGDGGGVSIKRYATLSHCTIIHNKISGSYGNGGGVFAASSSSLPNPSAITIDHCVISYNTSAMYGGGGGIAFLSGGTISNCLIANNTGLQYGGGIMGSADVVNTTIVHNFGEAGVDGATSLTNCIVWGNESYNYSGNIKGTGTVCSHCAIEGGYPGNNMILLGIDSIRQPNFVNPSLTTGADDTTSNVNWHLQDNSVCINRGNNAAAIGDFDLDGTARIKNDIVDIGCYESEYDIVSLYEPTYGNIIYVTQNGAGTQTGENWSNATPSIAIACALARTHSAVVWVATGTYFGDTTASYAFTMIDGVSVYGGFAGNEPADYNLSMRDFETNPSILDGQNSRSVLNADDLPCTWTTWDGFTIQNGYAQWYAAGVMLDKKCALNHCVVQNNNGVGIYVSSRSLINLGDVVVSHCKVINNTKGMSSIPGKTLVSDCLIANNSSAQNSQVFYGIFHIVNSNIVNNTGYGIGKGYSGDSTLVVNCIISGNRIDGAPSNIMDSAFCSCHYSAIEGGYNGENNIDISDMQLFYNPTQTVGMTANAASADWHLLPNSVCINKGINDSVMGLVDLVGLPRILCDTVDMGCYEHYPVHEIYDTVNNSYTWHGSTYTNSGDYFWQDATTSGCDTVHILHLTIIVGLNNLDDADFKVYPNPTSGVVNVQCTMNNVQEGTIGFHVYDAFGRLLRTTDGVKTQNFASLQTDTGSSVQTQIDLSEFAPGVYFIKTVVDENTVKTMKIVRN